VHSFSRFNLKGTTRDSVRCLARMCTASPSMGRNVRLLLLRSAARGTAALSLRCVGSMRSWRPSPEVRWLDLAARCCAVPFIAIVLP
jgi:hypothetical protein